METQCKNPRFIRLQNQMVWNLCNSTGHLDFLGGDFFLWFCIGYYWIPVVVFLVEKQLFLVYTMSYKLCGVEILFVLQLDRNDTITELLAVKFCLLWSLCSLLPYIKFYKKHL